VQHRGPIRDKPLPNRFVLPGRVDVYVAAAGEPVSWGTYTGIGEGVTMRVSTFHVEWGDLDDRGTAAVPSVAELDTVLDQIEVSHGPDGHPFKVGIFADDITYGPLRVGVEITLGHPERASVFYVGCVMEPASGTTPSGSPTAARCWLRYAFGAGAAEDLKGGAGEEGFEADPAKADEAVCERWPKVRVIIAMTTTRPTRRSRRIQWVVVRADDGVRVMPPVKAAWRCQRVSGF
jgi:hypothetical protein